VVEVVEAVVVCVDTKDPVAVITREPEIVETVVKSAVLTTVLVTTVSTVACLAATLLRASRTGAGPSITMTLTAVLVDS
jgi:hypothetical protein